MDARSTETAPDELVSEVGGLLTGLGIISMTLFPFALPLIILTAVARPATAGAGPARAGALAAGARADRAHAAAGCGR